MKQSKSFLTCSNTIYIILYYLRGSFISHLGRVRLRVWLRTQLGASKSCKVASILLLVSRSQPAALAKRDYSYLGASKSWTLPFEIQPWA